MDANRTSPVSGLVFDAASLCDCHSWLRWLWQAAQRFGWSANYPQTVAQWYLQPRDSAAPDGPAHCRARIERWLRESCLSTGQANELSYAAASRVRANQAALCLLPGVADALRQLTSRGVGLVMLTDALDDSESWQVRLKQWGCGESIETVPLCGADSFDQGVRTGGDQLGVPFCELGYVGVCTTRLHMAADLGLRTFALGVEPGPEVDHRLNQLGELVELIGSVELVPMAA